VSLVVLHEMPARAEMTLPIVLPSWASSLALIWLSCHRTIAHHNK
jgi:hypothetical protein